MHRADRRQRSEDRGDEVGSVNAEVGRKKKKGLRRKAQGARQRNRVEYC